MPFDFKQLEQILVCPASKSPLVQDGSALVCTSSACRLRYAIKDDIPIMLVEEAEAVPQGDWDSIMKRHGHTPGT